MVKARFHKERVMDGDEIELPDSITALTILHNPNIGAYVVTWLEEVKE